MGRRPKKGNTENIYLRGQTWYIRFKYRGRLYRESSDSSDKEIARRLLEQRQLEIQEGRFAPRADSTTFDHLVALIEGEYTSNGRKSLGSLQDRIESLRQHFGKRLPVDVTYADLDDYRVARLAKGAKPATVRYELVVFGKMFSLAIKAKMLTTKPLLPTVKVDNARRGFFEADEIARVLKHLPEDIAPAIEFAYYTGWRIGEIRKLTWTDHLDLDAGLIRLEASEVKNAAGKSFPFAAHPALRNLVVRQCERALKTGVKWLFPRADGRRLGNFHRQWTRACREAGVPGKVVHDLRRTAVRNLVRSGVHEKVAMALAGFKTRNVFDRYNIVSEADLADGVKKLAQRSQGD